MTIPQGKIAWVWEDQPPAVPPAGYDTVIVKVADGLSVKNAAGFSWADNFLRWRTVYRPVAIHAWGFPYIGDGVRFGENIAPHVVGASSLVLDVEDAGGQRWTDAALTALVEGCRAHLPGLSLGYSSYPTKAQCLEHSINQPLLERLCDFAMPQVYYPYQVDAWNEVKADHHRIVPVVSPTYDSAWRGVADEALTKGGGVSFWREGVSGWQDWPAHMEADPHPAPPVVPAADPLRPTAWSAVFPARFIAWDGTGWWLTDGMVRRPMTEQMAAGLHGFQVPVCWWPHCAAETALLHVG